MPFESTNTVINGTPSAAAAVRVRPLSGTTQHKLQDYLYQTYLSPSSSYTQSSLFTQYAPLTILLSIFALPRYIDLSAVPLWQILGHFLLATCVGLVLLRVLIWVGARMVWAFCELDLGGREKEKIWGESHGADGEVEMELTEGNLILGGLFG